MRPTNPLPGAYVALARHVLNDGARTRRAVLLIVSTLLACALGVALVAAAVVLAASRSPHLQSTPCAHGSCTGGQITQPRAVHSAPSAISGRRRPKLCLHRLKAPGKAR